MKIRLKNKEFELSLGPLWIIIFLLIIAAIFGLIKWTTLGTFLTIVVCVFLGFVLLLLIYILFSHLRKRIDK